jgi:hypothetical protein
VLLSDELKEAEDWPATIKVLALRYEVWHGDPSPFNYSLKAASPPLKDLATPAAENEAARRILFVAAGAFRWRQQKGAFPAESPIKGTMEIDPFTKKPMEFSNPGTGFYLFSVGVDGMSAKGTSEEGLEFDLDIGFKYRGFQTAEGTTPAAQR